MMLVFADALPADVLAPDLGPSDPSNICAFSRGAATRDSRLATPVVGNYSARANFPEFVTGFVETGERRHWPRSAYDR